MKFSIQLCFLFGFDLRRNNIQKRLFILKKKKQLAKQKYFLLQCSFRSSAPIFMDSWTHFQGNNTNKDYHYNDCNFKMVCRHLVNNQLNNHMDQQSFHINNFAIIYICDSKNNVLKKFNNLLTF